MAEQIEMLFGLCAQVGSANNVFDGGPDHPMQKSHF